MRIRHWISLLAILPIVACGEWKVEGDPKQIVEEVDVSNKTGVGSGAGQSGERSLEEDSALIEVIFSEEIATIQMTGELARSIYNRIQVEPVERDLVQVKEGESITCQLDAAEVAQCQLDIDLLTGGAIHQREISLLDENQVSTGKVELRLTDDLAIQLHDAIATSTSKDIHGFNVRTGDQVLCMSATDTSELTGSLDYTTMCKFTIDSLGGLIPVGESTRESAESELVETILYINGVLDEPLSSADLGLGAQTPAE